METHSQSECQICFNPYSPLRRPKLLSCQHTCCSVCLDQIMLNHREIHCPWCRQITHLGGFSVFQLPDDPKVFSTLALVHSPVFIRLPNSSCYSLPLATDKHTYHNSYKTTRDDQPEQTAREDEEEEERDVVMKGSAFTRFCAVLLVAVILLFLLVIVLHNMSCVSKRFSIISCE